MLANIEAGRFFVLGVLLYFAKLFSNELVRDQSGQQGKELVNAIESKLPSTLLDRLNLAVC